MTALERLAAPAFARDNLIRPNARHLGFLIAAFNVLGCIHWFFLLHRDLGRLRTASPLELLVGVLLPQLLMVAGGVGMMLGDARGKQLVVLSIPVGFIYALAFAIASPYAIIGVPFAVLIMTSWLSVFYYVVVTSQTGTDPNRWRRAISTVVVVLAVGFLLMYASLVNSDVASIRGLAMVGAGYVAPA